MPPLTAGGLLERARAGLDRMTPHRTWEALQRSEITLVDTRCADARDRDGVIPGSVHAPLSVLFWRADPSSGHDDPRISHSARPLVILCADGYSSSLAAATLQEMGRSDTTDVIGGYSAWRTAGLPLEPLPPRAD